MAHESEYHSTINLVILDHHIPCKKEHIPCKKEHGKDGFLFFPFSHCIRYSLSLSLKL